MLETQKAKGKGKTVTVTTAGTRVQVSSTPLWVRGLVVTAPSTNTGIVYFGDVTVSATAGGPIEKGTSMKVEFASPVDVAIDLSGQYVDAATNGDKVGFFWLEVVQ